MSEAAAKVIGSSTREDLCLASEASKRARLHHAITVSLKRFAVVTGRSWKSSLGEQQFAVTKDSTGM
jgi:hypothetical protein